MIRTLDASGDDRFMQRYIDRYCYLGGSSKTNSTQQGQQAQTSSNTIDPQELALLQGNYASAQQRASSLTPYTGQLTAGFTPTQTQAQGVLTGIGTDPSYTAANNNAIGSVQGILNNPSNPNITSQGVNPQTVSSNPIAGAQSITSSPVTAGLLSNTDLSPYLNPYTNDVINASVAQNAVARQNAQVQDAQQATAQGAFGGSRSGVASALTNQLYDQNNQSNIANLNSANFSQAQAAATGDINRTLGANQFNATNDQSAQSQNAANTLASQEYNSGQNYNAQIANQTAGLNAGEFNSTANTNAQQASFNNQLAQAGLTMNAAGQIVALNNANLGTATSQAGILASVGDAQQQQQQQQLTDAYNAYTQGQQLTVEQQQLLNQSLGLIPNQQTVTSSGTSSGTGSGTTTTNPGLGSILGGVGSLFTGIGDLRSS